MYNIIKHTRKDVIKINIELVSALKKARINKALTQEEVANIVGVKYNTLSNWENGRSQPDIDTLVKLCSIYEINCANLLNIAYAIEPTVEQPSPKEQTLIKAFRTLNNEGQQKVIEDTENLTFIPKYKITKIKPTENEKQVIPIKQKVLKQIARDGEEREITDPEEVENMKNFFDSEMKKFDKEPKNYDI